jgi:hypothetical protein
VAVDGGVIVYLLFALLAAWVFINPTGKDINWHIAGLPPMQDMITCLTNVRMQTNACGTMPLLTLPLAQLCV